MNKTETDQINTNSIDSKKQSRSESRKQSAQNTQSKSFKTIEELSGESKKRSKINSPRSLHAIHISGYLLDDLYYMTFDEFQKTHPETIKMSKDDQKKRYDFLEELRKRKISEISEIRNKLIEEEEAENYDSERENIKHTNRQAQTNRSKITNTNMDYDEHQEKKMEIIKHKNDKVVSLLVQDKFDEDLRAYTSSLYSLKTDRNQKKTETTQRTEPKKNNSEKSKREQRLQQVEKRKELVEHNLIKNELKREQKREELKKKIQKKNLSTYEILLKNQEEHHEKCQANTEREIMKEEHIRRLFALQEQERQKKYNEIMKKQEQSEMFKTQKRENNISKVRTIEEMEKKKNDDIDKVEKIFKKGVNEKSIKQIQEEFPDNEEIKETIDRYYQQKKQITEETMGKEEEKKEEEKNEEKETIEHETHDKEKENDKEKQKQEEKEIMNKEKEEFKEKIEQQSFCQTEIDKKSNKDFKLEEDNQSNKEKSKVKRPQSDSRLDKKVKENKKETKEEEKQKEEEPNKENEEEIKKKVSDYKIQLTKNFLQMLQNEKERENERQQKLRMTKNKEEREKMEYNFGRERTMVNLRLSREQDKIEHKVILYENELRKKNK